MTVYVQKLGAGPIAWLGFHGWSGTHSTFLPLAPHLPDGVSLFAFDHPGFGQSPAPAEWTFEACTASLAAALADLDLDRVSLVGSCSGAFTALHLAGVLGSRVDRIVLIDPFAYVPWYFRLLTFGSLGKLFYFSTFANPIGRWLTNVALAARRDKDTNLTGAFGSLDHGNAHAYLELLCSLESIEVFREVQTRVDIIYGEKTFGAVRRGVDMWRKMWPHAQSHELPGAGHLPIEEATRAVAHVMFDSPSPREAAGLGTGGAQVRNKEVWYDGARV